MKPGRGSAIVTGSDGRLGDAVMRRLAGRSEDVVGFERNAPRPSRSIALDERQRFLVLRVLLI